MSWRGVADPPLPPVRRLTFSQLRSSTPPKHRPLLFFILATLSSVAAFTTSAPRPRPRPHHHRLGAAAAASEEAARINGAYRELRISQGGVAAELQRVLQRGSSRAVAAAALVEELTARVEEAEEDLTSNIDLGLLQGDWQLVYQYSSKEATNSQKAFGKSGLPQMSNFLQDEQGREVFRNIVAVTKNRVRVVADVAWTAPTAEEPRRLGSTICRAGVEVGVGRRFGWTRPLRIPLPLKGEGWLDVTHISEDMRITRGNRGGLFVQH